MIVGLISASLQAISIKNLTQSEFLICWESPISDTWYDSFLCRPGQRFEVEKSGSFFFVEIKKNSKIIKSPSDLKSIEIEKNEEEFILKGDGVVLDSEYYENESLSFYIGYVLAD